MPSSPNEISVVSVLAEELGVPRGEFILMVLAELHGNSKGIIDIHSVCEELGCSRSMLHTVLSDVWYALP